MKVHLNKRLLLVYRVSSLLHLPDSDLRKDVVPDIADNSFTAAASVSN